MSRRPTALLAICSTHLCACPRCEASDPVPGGQLAARLEVETVGVPTDRWALPPLTRSPIDPQAARAPAWAGAPAGRDNA
ncbi:MAG TPA: hypothetical protein VMW47_09520 [Verrucomicrobiae bacterium]|nr:hypothetical protein [Verrucomicrobiae bacterium]